MPRQRPAAFVALAVLLAASVVITGVLSPPILRVLHAAGASGASLAEVTLRTLELTAIALTFALLANPSSGTNRRNRIDLIGVSWCYAPVPRLLLSAD